MNMNIFASKYSNIFECPNIRYTLPSGQKISWKKKEREEKNGVNSGHLVPCQPK